MAAISQTAGFAAVDFLRGSSQCMRAGSLLLTISWGLSLFFLIRTLHCHVLEGINNIM